MTIVFPRLGAAVKNTPKLSQKRRFKAQRKPADACVFLLRSVANLTLEETYLQHDIVGRAMKGLSVLDREQPAPLNTTGSVGSVRVTCRPGKQSSGCSGSCNYGATNTRTSVPQYRQILQAVPGDRGETKLLAQILDTR